MVRQARGERDGGLEKRGRGGEVLCVDPRLLSGRRAFGAGVTEIAGADDGVGIGVAVVRLEAGERVSLVAERETAWLLMDGELDVSVRDPGARPRGARWSRASLWDERPSCAHVAAGTELTLAAHGAVELLRCSTRSTARFAPSLYEPSDIREEQRGEGQVHGACHRVVRTIFDRRNADPAAALVLGEVITLPGRWSSYPPHHHAQPEIYHYRFTAPQGYGHAELGETVLKVRDRDTVIIDAPNDHAQVAAPGYGMYYAWAIRHLPGDPYLAPVFTEEHRWVMEPGAKTWWPEGVS